MKREKDTIVSDFRKNRSEPYGWQVKEINVRVTCAYMNTMLVMTNGTDMNVAISLNLALFHI